MRALRKELRLTESTFPSDRKLPRRVFLDEGREFGLEPDLSWWDGATCTFVGDAKYKRVKNERVPNADLYQLLAYTTALDLPGGLLIYAEGEPGSTVHQVLHAGKRLEVATVDLSGSVRDLHGEISMLADRVEALRREAAIHRQAA